MGEWIFLVPTNLASPKYTSGLSECQVLLLVYCLLECMIIDGVRARHSVADYVHAIMMGEGTDE